MVVEDIRIAWCDIYLRAIGMRCGRAFTETELEGLEFVMQLAREEIENPTGLITVPDDDEDDSEADDVESSAPKIMFDGGIARMISHECVE